VDVAGDFVAGGAPAGGGEAKGLGQTSAALAAKPGVHYTSGMATIAEVEKLAFDLPDSERAVLAAHLLRSLPSVLHDEDEGVAEALRRDADLDANPETGITLEQLDEGIRNRRP
jgi:putative addiction module component (TIGR02574 family)